MTVRDEATWTVGDAEAEADGEAADEELVREALAGSDAALDQLIRRHEVRVLRLLRLLDVRAVDREDVAQEIFLRVFRHLRGFRQGRSFRAWLYRISVNAAHDYRHAARRRPEQDGLDESVARQPDSGPGPEEAAEGRARQRDLLLALARLSERERAVFVLCEVEGLPTREVARALGITTITVRRHLGRSRQRLREVLEEIEKKSPRG